MLVLTRRENEKIVFPDVGITVELISITGSRARIGVRAPAEIRVLRHEIAGNAMEEARIAAQRPTAKTLSHDLRNRLNAANIATQLLRRQIETGRIEGADETLQLLQRELIGLTRELAGPVNDPQKPASCKPRRALLVEDNANERKLLASFLQMSGFEVDTAEDGADALDYLASHARPDVVLLDMFMPRCDGPKAVGEMRSIPELEGLKIFAVSGTSPDKLGVETGPRGIDRWFHKPIDPEDLVRTLARDLIAPQVVA